LSNPKHPKFKANYDKWIKKNPGKKLADFVAAMKKKDAAMNEAAYDEPAAPDADAIAKRKRLQALKDKQEDERGYGKDETNTPIRKVAGKAYGGAAQKDEPEIDEDFGLGAAIAGSALVGAKLGKTAGIYSDAKSKEKAGYAKPRGGMERLKGAWKGVASPEYGDQDDVRKENPNWIYEKDDLDEVAPPGAKAERMVKHIKKGYAKDGKLSKKEKGIAYATAWKAHNKGQVEEFIDPSLLQAAVPGLMGAGMGAVAGASALKHMFKKGDQQKHQAEKDFKKSQVGEGTDFKDTIANSKAELKKAKPAMVKEGRVMEETDYFYEKIGKALAEKNSYLDTASGEFVDAVRKEMVAQGIPPNRARGIILQDEDFISDVATSYGHYCSVDAHHPLPAEIDLGNTKELDEIAALAGLATRAPAIASAVSTMTDSKDMEEDAMGAVMGGIAGGMVGKTPGAVATGAKLGSAARDTFNSATGLDEITAPPKAVPSNKKSTFDPSTLKAPGAKPLRPMADTSRLNAPADSVSEEEVEEGNEFSGALAKAKASGAKEFEVDGKRYTVKEDINVNITANGQEDALNLFRKLAGMDEVKSEPMVQDPVKGAVPLGNIPTLDLESAIEQGIIEPVEEERDIEYANTPNEKIGPVSAAIPSGTDLNRSKKQYRKEYPGDNPMAVREETLWKSYKNMINDIKG
jgi:hypothetical protein